MIHLSEWRENDPLRWSQWLEEGQDLFTERRNIFLRVDIRLWRSRSLIRRGYIVVPPSKRQIGLGV